MTHPLAAALTACADALAAFDRFAWQAERSRTGSVKAVGTGEHAGRVLYGARATAALKAGAGGGAGAGTPAKAKSPARPAAGAAKAKPAPKAAAPRPPSAAARVAAERAALSPAARAAVDAELWNAGIRAPGRPPAKVDEALLARRLASAYEDLSAGGAPAADLAAVGRMLGHAGAAVRGAPGDLVPFDGEHHAGPPGSFTGDRVRVVSPAVTRGGRVLVKARTEPAPVDLAAPTAAKPARPAAAPAKK